MLGDTVAGCPQSSYFSFGPRFSFLAKFPFFRHLSLPPAKRKTKLITKYQMIRTTSNETVLRTSTYTYKFNLLKTVIFVDVFMDIFDHF